MAVSLYDFSIIRRKNGVSTPAPVPDLQAERACRDLATYLTSLAAQPVGAAVGANGGDGTAVHAAAPPQPTPAGLASALQMNWPGAAAAVTMEYIWVLDPVTGQRIQLCINDEVVLASEQPAAGSAKPVDPTLVISFRMLM
jgi:hypothetical protein